VASAAPKTSVQQDTIYYFIPDATANNGAPLTFDIANQPGWTDFNITSGELTGIPTGDDAGIYKDIVISTDNGEANANIPADDLRHNNDVRDELVQTTGNPSRFRPFSGSKQILPYPRRQTTAVAKP
jgi:hypothetical protein